MCFAPEADLVGGIVISGVGIDALRHVRRRREVALAALPLLFGTHQLVEALAWWGLEGAVPGRIGVLARDVYLLIAFVLPLVVPLAVLFIEPDPDRRAVMTPFVLIGGLVTAILLTEMAGGPVTAEVCERYIAYDASLGFGGPVTALYVAAVCMPLLVSSHRLLRLFGAVNAVAVAGLAWLLTAGFISLWCAWAAVFSVVIVVHLRTRERDRVVLEV
jgi:hypothetical protein